MIGVQQVVRPFRKRMPQILLIKPLHLGVLMRKTDGIGGVDLVQQTAALSRQLTALADRLAAAARAAARAGHHLNKVILHFSVQQRANQTVGIAQPADRRHPQGVSSERELRLAPTLFTAYLREGIRVGVRSRSEEAGAAQRLLPRYGIEPRPGCLRGDTR